MNRPASVIAIFLVAAAGLPSTAQEPEPEGAHACEAFARSTPEALAWWTIYYGERGRTVGQSEVREWTREVRCFASEADCDAWLAWAHTNWPDRGFSRRCRNGLPPWLSGPET